MSDRRPPRGRGSASNPANRFTRMEIVPDDPQDRVDTIYLRDSSRTAITRNASPDIPYDRSLNPYRGCEHGCSYCYARPYHEYLGFSSGLDFETRILVKEGLPELLAAELDSPSYEPAPLDLSGVTDAYQPVERRLALTRRCLEALAHRRHPVVIVTKNALVSRDLDLLSSLAERRAAAVWLSITTLNPDLSHRLEPRTSAPRRRLEAIRELRDAGVPAGVLVAPVIPGLTDYELPSVLGAAREAGAQFAGWSIIRLPGAVAQIFSDWLETHEPNRASGVLRRIRDLHGGRLNDSRFGRRMQGDGLIAHQIGRLFDVTTGRLGLRKDRPTLSCRAFRSSRPHQSRLF